MLDLTVQPNPVAIARQTGKVPVASLLRTKEWAEIRIGLRDRAFFSAGIDQLRTLQQMQSRLAEWATMARDNPQRAFMDRSKFVSEIRQSIGAAPGDTKDLTDITSRRRLELIYDFQTQDAAEFARWQTSQDPVILDEWPAQELIRVEDRRIERDWEDRWQRAGGQIHQGRMIALKTDPVWTRISRFNRPWPPFDFGSGMGVQDIDRLEAEALGLLAPAEPVRPIPESFNRSLEQSVSDLSPDLQEALQSHFGDQVIIERGKARWANTSHSSHTSQA
jgi:hypothetical protein